MTTPIEASPQQSQPIVSPGPNFVEFSEEATRASIGERFRLAAQTHGDKLAVCESNKRLSYTVLNRQVEAIARAVLAHDDTSGGGVALLLGHNTDMVAAILGVLLAGKHYVPLDAAFPDSRNAYILQDSGCDLVITNSANLDTTRALAGSGHCFINLDEIQPGDSNTPFPQVEPGSLAYIMYTSGSTGQPKGVMQTHQAILRVARRYSNGLKIGSGDRVTHLASFSVTASVGNMLSALLNGAGLYLYDLLDDGIANLQEWMISHDITVYHSVASVLRSFCATLPEKQFPSLRVVRLGGDRAYKSDVELFKKHFHDDCLMINGYGSSEISSVFQYCIDKDTVIEQDSVPVGWPLDDTAFQLLDDEGQQVADGSVGEIVIKSPYLAAGYWNKPELSSEIFKSDPVDGVQTYHTGDMGYLTPDGCLVHRGRKDFQTKIRGFRVELGEIERSLARHPAVKEAVLSTQAGPGGETRLAAYVLSATGEFDANELRSFLRASLPEYMVPALFAQIDSIPHTPNGKVDRQALPPIEEANPDESEAANEAGNELEQAIARIWCEALELESVGLDENFFDHGGSSLTANLVVTRIRDTLGAEISLRVFFEAPTIRELAAELPQ